MPLMLEGGCFVTGLKEGEPELRDGIRIWRHVHREVGAQAISLRILEFLPGRSPELRNFECDEVLYILNGAGSLFLDDRRYEIEADTGIFVGPRSSFSILNNSAGSITIASAQCPEPDPSVRLSAESSAREREHPRMHPIVRLRDRVSEKTGDRWYRVLVDRELGCNESTQFVGSIPPGRAPDHFHHYEEVLCILRGSGRMWAGESSAPIEAGSCIFLPRRQLHCVENTGRSELRLLGVFHPAGSPADRYS